MSRPLVMYHANCNDGFCAAWVAWRKFGNGADYVPVQYGQPPPDVTGRDLYVLDFSFSYGVLQQLEKEATAIILLDHHQTARKELDSFAADSELLTGRKPLIVFDMGKSGGRLAWEHFFPGKKAPWIVDYTEDRDLWRHALPNSGAINAALSSYPRTFLMWDLLSGWDVRTLAVEGVAIERYKETLVEALCASAREIDLGGHRVPAVNTPLLQSEVAGKLAAGKPFAACWYERGGKVYWSLRSDENGQDVSLVAQRLGGGGHQHAAGFVSVPGNK